MYVLGAQKNHLIEIVLLSTHNICFGCRIRKIIFSYACLLKTSEGGGVGHFVFAFAYKGP